MEALETSHGTYILSQLQPSVYEACRANISRTETERQGPLPPAFPVVHRFLYVAGLVLKARQQVHWAGSRNVWTLALAAHKPATGPCTFHLSGSRALHLEMGVFKKEGIKTMTSKCW